MTQTSGDRSCSVLLSGTSATWDDLVPRRIGMLFAVCLIVGHLPEQLRAGDAGQTEQELNQNSQFEPGTPDDARVAGSTLDADLTAGLIDLSGYDPKLADIITAVMEQEQRYANLESVVRTEWHYDPAKWTIPESTLTVHTIRQGRLLSVEGESIDTLTRGGEVRHRFASAYDGRRSVSVEYEDSVNIHDRRFEASQVFPPHTWGMFHLEVNFPLSVCLAGTNALTRHPKVRRSPVARGTAFDFHKVECEAAGSERIGDFDCEKIRVRRWYDLNSGPAIQYLWLAPERNYLCVKSQLMAPVPGSNLPGIESVVESFRQIGPDLWLPERVRVAYYDYDSVKQGTLIPHLTRSLVLETAVMNPAFPAGRFQLAVPGDIPVYKIGADSVVDTPHHPHPAGRARSTTFAGIIAGIRRNEMLYQSIDLSLAEEYVKPWLHNEFLDESGYELYRSTTHTHSLSRGGRTYSRAESIHASPDGTPVVDVTLRAGDGEWLRQVSTTNRNNPDTFVVRWASLTRDDGQDRRRLFVHALLFDDSFEGALSDCLESQILHTVAYEGDDVIDGLLCHRLRIDHLEGPERRVSSSLTIWICPERNYLPIRTQWLTPKWHPTLITGMATVEEWRALSRDIWLPARWTHTAFKRFEFTGVCENRLIHNWRKDCHVENAALDPHPEPELFRSVTAPRGTKISIRDSSGTDLGTVLQEQDGVLTISQEELRKLSEPGKPATENQPPADNNGAAAASTGASQADPGTHSHNGSLMRLTQLGHHFSKPGIDR